MGGNTFQSFWIVIPTVIFEDERVPLRAKKLYGLISSLTQKEGFCWASNNFLSKKSKIPLGTVRRYLKLLKKLKYIDCEINEEGNQRKIWIIALVGKPVENSGEKPKMKDKRMLTVIRSHEQGDAHVLDRSEHQDNKEN